MYTTPALILSHLLLIKLILPCLHIRTFQNNVNGMMFALYIGDIPRSIPLIIFQIPLYSILSHFSSLLYNRLQIPVSHVTFISQFDINDFFLLMFAVLISVCMLLHLVLVTMHRMCLAIPVLGLAKCIPSVTFSCSSLNFLFHLPDFVLPVCQS